MVARKARIVIIGAGMAGLVAAHSLYKASCGKEVFEVCVVEGGDRIGGRICTSEFGGDQIEMGATWIHGIGGSPVHQIAKDIGALHSEKPWERMDGFPADPVTMAEGGGFGIDASVVDCVSNLYKKLMEFAQGKLLVEDWHYKIAAEAFKSCVENDAQAISIGSFLRRGLEVYWGYGEHVRRSEKENGCSHKLVVEEAIFAMHENTERTYTSAGDLHHLDFHAEREYDQFPDEEITIAKGYSSVIRSIASVLPSGLIKLGKRVAKIEWQLNISGGGPVKLHFDDGSTMVADHVIVTVSLGVLKAGIGDKSSGMFNPPLPSFKTEAISRLGFGVVNKLFLQLDASHEAAAFPFLQMAFQQSDYSKAPKIPWWMRRTTSLCPVHNNSRVLLSWFAGEEAVELENLQDQDILEGVSNTVSAFLQHKGEYKFTKLVKSGWGTNPLFKGSYSYVAVGSSGEDLDSMATPLPSLTREGVPPLQILFAGEATHRTHYSTTHGAYFSGIREANRLLQHYHN